MTELLHHKPTLILLGISKALLLAGLVIIIVSAGNLSTPLVLHFDMNGIDRYGSVTDLWGIWIVGLGILLINTFLARSFFFREKIISYVILTITPLIMLFFLIAIATIVSVN